MTASPTDVKYIVRDPEIFGGKPCIEGHRISVHDVATWHRQGETADAIAKDFGLTRAQVHAALAYYYDHQEEIDHELAAEEEELARRARTDTSPLARSLREEARKRGRPTRHG